MIHTVIWPTNSREMAEYIAEASDRWSQDFPDKPLNYVMNPMAVRINKETLVDPEKPRPPFNFIFIFDNADDALLFKLGYFKAEE